MRIILTGVSGFIGSNLALHLLKDGHEVIGVDNFITGTKSNLDDLYLYPSFHFMEWDVIYPLKNIDGPIDWVMHFASPASPPKYLGVPLETLRVNSEGTYHLLELAFAKDSKFLFSSTSEIYGDPEVHPQTETYWGNVNPIGPRSVYDEAKRYAEALISSYKKTKNLSIRIIRIFNTFGPRMGLNDGRIMSTLITNALRNQPITLQGDGSQTRSFQYIDDLVAGITRLMKVDFQQPLNLGNPEELSVLEIAEIITELTQSKSKIQFIPLGGDDPKRRKPDITLAKKVLNWEPQIRTKEGINRMISWMQEKYSNLERENLQS